MTILSTKQVWRKAISPLPQGKRAGARLDRLTPEQEASVRAWMRVLHKKHGTWQRASDALGIGLATIERVMSGARRPTAGWALRLAERLPESVDAVLGAKGSACPTCGRRTD